MPKLYSLSIALAGSAVLSACSPSAAGSHPVCKDAISTQDYGVKWMDDLATASRAGKVPTSSVVEIHGESFSKFGLLKEKRFADYCNHLDAVRKFSDF